MTFDALPKLTERAWQQQVLKLADIFSWKYWHDQATNAPRACPHCKTPLKLPRNDPGWPDLFMVRGDTLVIAELKSARGRVSDEQKEWLSALRGVRRIAVFVWRPRHLDEVMRTLR